MKLLQIVASMNPKDGGPVEGIIRQGESFGDRCIQEIATLDIADAPYLADVPFKTYALGEANPIAPLNRYRYSSKFVPWLKQNVARYDAVIVNGLWNYSSFASSQVLPQSKTPYFVFTHGMMDPWFRKTMPRKHLAKQLFWLTGEGRLMHHAVSALFTTEEERLLARGQFIGHSYKESVVGYGAASPPARTEAQTEAFFAVAPQLLGKAYLLYLGRIHPKKGGDLLMESLAAAVREHPELELAMVGPDSDGYEAQLRSQAQDLGIGDKVHWLGPLFDDAKWGALYNADAFVLPSHQENFGVAVAEALACSVPVLVSNKVNIWHEIEASAAGLVADDTVAGTTAILNRWAAMPADEKGLMRTRAARLFDSRFKMSAAADRLLATMTQLIEADTAVPYVGELRMA